MRDQTIVSPSGAPTFDVDPFGAPPPPKSGGAPGVGSVAPRRERPQAAPDNSGRALQALATLSRGGLGDNQLVVAAAGLLSLIVQLRNTAGSPDASALQRLAIEEVKRFEEDALKNGCKGEDVRAARYILCAVLDETVLGTPWGYESDWSRKSLLSIFHNETWGGEKVFLILDRVKQNPRRYIDLLELIDLCLSLGFEGRYRVMENGAHQFEQVRDDLFRTIRSQRGEPESRLSPNWEGAGETEGQTLRRYIPIWVVAVSTAVFMLLVYIAFEFLVSLEVDPLVARLNSTANPPTPQLISGGSAGAAGAQPIPGADASINPYIEPPGAAQQVERVLGPVPGTAPSPAVPSAGTPPAAPTTSAAGGAAAPSADSFGSPTAVPAPVPSGTAPTPATAPVTAPAAQPQASQPTAPVPADTAAATQPAGQPDGGEAPTGPAPTGQATTSQPSTADGQTPAAPKPDAAAFGAADAPVPQPVTTAPGAGTEGAATGETGSTGTGAAQ